MANTLPLLKLDPTQYVSVYEILNIPIGTPLNIQSISPKPVKINTGPFQPLTSTDKHYFLLDDEFTTISINASENGCWLLGYGFVNVQIATDKIGVPDHTQVLDNIVIALSENLKALNLLNAKFEEAWDTKIFTRDV